MPTHLEPCQLAGNSQGIPLHVVNGRVCMLQCAAVGCVPRRACRCQWVRQGAGGVAAQRAHICQLGGSVHGAGTALGRAGLGQLVGRGGRMRVCCCLGRCRHWIQIHLIAVRWCRPCCGHLTSRGTLCWRFGRGLAGPAALLCSLLGSCQIRLCTDVARACAPCSCKLNSGIWRVRGSGVRERDRSSRVCPWLARWVSSQRRRGLGGHPGCVERHGVLAQRLLPWGWRLLLLLPLQPLRRVPTPWRSQRASGGTPHST